MSQKSPQKRHDPKNLADAAGAAPMDSQPVRPLSNDVIKARDEFEDVRQALREARASYMDARGPWWSFITNWWFVRLSALRRTRNALPK